MCPATSRLWKTGGPFDLKEFRKYGIVKEPVIGTFEGWAADSLMDQARMSMKDLAYDHLPWAAYIYCLSSDCSSVTIYPLN